MPSFSRTAAPQARTGEFWKLGTLAVVIAAAIAAVSPGFAQDARHFSPTYAASDGSPYSGVYARTFGAGGPPAEPAAPPEAPLETSAAPVAPPAQDGAGSVVYVIQDGRLLTYRAEDYARGGRAVSGAPVPPAASEAPALSSITGRFYGAAETGSPPHAPAAVPEPGGPIPLVPSGN